MLSEKNVLLLHYYYPPIRSGAVFRNYFFSIEFSKIFKKVFVLTTSNRNILEKEVQHIPDKITVVEVRTMDYRRLLFRTTKKNHLKEETKDNILSQIFIRLQKTLPFSFFMGEGGPLYIWDAYCKAKYLVREHAISVVYSSFGPYADHLVAYLLKREFPAIRWIADFRDLQIEPIYNNAYFEKLQRLIEHKILQKADLITTVSEGLKMHMIRYGRPVMAIPRGIRLRSFQNQTSEKFVICYTGSLYKQYRDATIFFELLLQLIDTNTIDPGHIVIEYAGRDGQQFAKYLHLFGLGHLFLDHGYISHDEVINLQNRSQLQLLLTSSSKDLTGVFTGKLYEYLESGNPILVIIKGARDHEFEKFISVTSSGAILYDPTENLQPIREFIIKLYNYWKETGNSMRLLNREYVSTDLSWPAQTQRLISSIIET